MYKAEDFPNELFGIKMSHSGISILYIDQLIQKYKPDVFIELGSGEGALTCFIKLRKILTNNPKEFISIDIKDTRHVFLKDIFIKKDAFKFIDDIKKLNKRLMIYDDCGDLIMKLKVFNKYANITKSGDLIGIHDLPASGDTKIIDEFNKICKVNRILVINERKTSNSDSFWWGIKK